MGEAPFQSKSICLSVRVTAGGAGEVVVVEVLAFEAFDGGSGGGAELGAGNDGGGVLRVGRALGVEDLCVGELCGEAVDRKDGVARDRVVVAFNRGE